jgi:Flp pilus assembly protein TadD
MGEAHPHDPRAHRGLALAYERPERWDDAGRHFRESLALAAVQGSAYGRLARALVQLGQIDDARATYRQGIAAANRHNHPTMVAAFEDEMDEL